LGEISIGLSIFDRLLAVLGMMRENKRLERERRDQALRAISAALIATKAYIVARQGGAAVDTSREIEIAGLWNEAAIPLGSIDPDFAARCFIKGGYWLEPGVWGDDQVRAKGIAIDQVFEETERMLRSRKES
jgi:hypothetical protein